MSSTSKSSRRIRFRFEGEVYQVDQAEVTGRLERELWQATRMSIAQVLEALVAGASFGLAAVLWMSRRQAGEQVSYESVEAWLDGLDKTEVDLELLPDVEGDDVPQLLGASSEV